MTARLDGKIAIVTGAARGMGEAHARLFVAEGATVVLTDVLDDLGRAVADDLGEAARFHHHDVSVPADWDTVVASTMREFGRVDGLVNNAAIHRLRLLRDETPDEFDRMLAVNLKGPFLGMQAVFEPMRAAGGGSIVNISSLAGVQPFYMHSAYSAAKYGLTGLTQVAAIEYGPSGIRVNSVHPGPIDTDMLPGPSGEDRFADHPLGRAGRPHEVAELVLFLVSDASSYVNGAQVRVDGGLGSGRLPPRPA